jgi:2'-hydroxyisoflavone reductase
MYLSRRAFLTSSIAAAAGAQAALAGIGQPKAPASPAEPAPADKLKVAKADKPLKVLFLGGTVFLGPHTVELLLARGHTVTLFNRGKTFPDLFPEVEKLRGERGTFGKAKAESDFKSLEAEIAKGRKWDVVIDTSAYVPKYMRASTAVLKDAVSHYVMVASINVYKSEAEPNQDENAPTWDKWPEEAAIDEKTYGPMKRGCEVVLSEMMPGRWASVRPSLIVGPRDWSSRFSYWPLRAMRGGEILSPVGPEEPCAFVDARDVAGLLVNIAEKKAVGPVNALGSPRMTFGPMLAEVLAAAKAAGAPASTLTWVPLMFINANNVQAWSDLPAWVPSADPEYAGFASRSGARSVELGATFRPVKETSADILKWWNTLPEARRAKPRPGLTVDRETELLALWRNTRPQTP